jgi:hypothetical protein
MTATLVLSGTSSAGTPPIASKAPTWPLIQSASPIRRAIPRVDIPADFNLITSRTWRIASLSVGIQVPFAKPKGGTVSEPEETSSPRATSSRNGGRDHLGMAGEIKSERWARSFRNRGRHRAESAPWTVRQNWLRFTHGFRAPAGR